MFLIYSTKYEQLLHKLVPIFHKQNLKLLPLDKNLELKIVGAGGLEPTEDRSRQIYSLVHLPLCYAPSKKSNRLY